MTEMARRFLANRFLRKQNLPQHAVEQHVEWCVHGRAHVTNLHDSARAALAADSVYAVAGCMHSMCTAMRTSRSSSCYTVS